MNFLSSIAGVRVKNSNVENSKNDKGFSKDDKKESKEINLDASKFRMLNEFLYTSKSNEAFKYFKNNKEDFKIYHEGFNNQSNKWPSNPNKIIAKELSKKMFMNKKIADLGCGEGYIQEKLNKEGNNSIYSYDLVSTKQFIFQCDITKLPVEKEFFDVCIFCLSLMGSNYIDFLIEANRVMKNKGILIIAEINSRINENFVKTINELGFDLRKTKDIEGYFTIFIFRKNNNIEGINKGKIKKYSNILNPCLYKKR